ncbi:MAG: hypothetical protein IJY20_01330 [Clostridia bacterium]|nr:hypothetical protein [Clostridia bacterium]
MKKFLSLLLLAAICLCVLPGCASLDTTGLLEAAPDLIRRAAALNEIYYGAGIPYDQSGEPIGNYYPADKSYLAEQGFSTIAELKSKTAAVFSVSYCEAIYAATLSGFAAEGSGYIIARYSSSQAENLRDENETILVSTTAENQLSHRVSITYDYAGVRLGEVGRNHAMVIIPTVTVFYADEDHPENYTVSEDMAIKFVYEDGWRIDSATY